jgi:uncharacterized tellurite resistance protein B-like protein
LKVHYHIRLDALLKQLADLTNYSSHTIPADASAIGVSNSISAPVDTSSTSQLSVNNRNLTENEPAAIPQMQPLATTPIPFQAKPQAMPSPTPIKNQTESSSGMGNIIGIALFGWILMKAFGKKTKKAPPKAKAAVSNRQESKPQKNDKPTSGQSAQWIMPGKTVAVAGHSISGGYIYIGTRLSANASSGNAQEPALINPALSVASRDPDTAGLQMGYWPSYSGISPACRLAYIQWLAAGKCDPNISIGYVFLYFYGLERRIVIDKPSPEEILLLIEEIKRLRTLYATNSSFANYSTRLLEAADLILTWRDGKTLETIIPEIENSRETERMRQLIGLALKMKDAAPLSFEWAMVGYLYAVGWHQRIAATRVRCVFLALMRKRFEKKWPQGLKLRQRQSQFSYPFQGASQYLRLDLADVLGMRALPDPQVFDWSKLVEMAGQAENDLAAYARAVGRDPAVAGTLKAILLLPPEIASEQITQLSAPIASLFADQHTPLKRIKIADLVQKITGEVPVTLDLRVWRNAAEVVAHMGYGIEPDPDFGQMRPKINDTCIVFDAIDLINPRAAASGAYVLAVSIAMLVAGVSGASADGMGADVTRWVGWIGQTLNLSNAETRRLHAHLMWLGDQRLTMTQVKRALAEVPAHQRDAIAWLAASVAAADGIIEKSEVAFLEKVYDELGIERSKLYGALHELAASGVDAAAEPVTVEKSKPPSGFKIQRPPNTQVNAQSGKKLDASRINKILEETQQVSSVLTTIFAGEEEPTAIAMPAPKTSGSGGRFAGLDDVNTVLAERLMAQDQWERSAFEAIARELGLMPDGALEAINEWAFERFGEAFAEDGDMMEINRALIEETDNNGERSEAA